jgi:SAM-dependent methyltransferase
MYMCIGDVKELQMDHDADCDPCAHDRDLEEGECFGAYTSKLNDYERAIIKRLAFVKPTYTMSNSNPELIAREIAPNGFKAIWEGLLRYKKINHLTQPLDKFLDLGCGAGQVMLMALVMTDAMACGIDIQQFLCDIARKWHANAAKELHSLRDIFTNQSSRIFCLDMTSRDALEIMAGANVIFCNNLLFSHSSRAPENNLNSKIMKQFDLLAARLPKDSYVYVISSATLSLGLETTITLPRECVSWAVEGNVQFYISLVRGTKD